VLVLFPASGDRIYGWERREIAIRNRLTDTESGLRLEQGQGIITACRRVSFGYRYLARFRLGIKGNPIYVTGSFYLSHPYAASAEGGWERLAVGDRIELSGIITFPEGPRNPGGFDEQLYDRINQIDVKIKPDQAVRKTASDPVFSFLACSRDAAAERISELWEQPCSGVICAMLLGDKSLLEEDLQELFSEAGIAHIIAISGLHISIIAEGIEKLLKGKLGDKKAGSLALVMIWLYALWTGCALATIRAALMLSVRRASRLFSRSYDPVCGIAFSMLVILVWKPMYFLSSGFWLSYMALIGMSAGSAIVMRIRIVPYLLRNFIASSLGVMLLTAPILLWSFYELSLFGFLLNLWVIPTVSSLMALAVLALLFSLISPGLSGSFVWVSSKLIESYQAGSRMFSGHPSLMLMGRPAARSVIGYYLILVLLWLLFMRRTDRKRMLRFMSVIALIAVLAFLPQNRRIVTFLDVGQGDCAVIEWEGSVILMDAGPGYEDVLDPYLKRQGICRIDAIVISHPDSDHIKGAIELAESGNYSVRYLILADQEAHRNELSEALENAVSRMGGQICRIGAGDELTLGTREPLVIRCLSPSREYAESNDGSLVLLVKGGDAAFLFTGDISELTEVDLIREGVLDGIGEITALKAAHHGSNYSTSDGFLDLVDPRLTVISCGVNNSYGHPGLEMLERLAAHHDPWRVTAVNGCIQIRLYSGRIQFRQYRTSGG